MFSSLSPVFLVVPLGRRLDRFAHIRNCSGSYVEDGLQGPGVAGEAITVVPVGDGGGLDWEVTGGREKRGCTRGMYRK